MEMRYRGGNRSRDGWSNGGDKNKGSSSWGKGSFHSEIGRKLSEMHGSPYGALKSLQSW